MFVFNLKVHIFTTVISALFDVLLVEQCNIASRQFIFLQTHGKLRTKLAQ